MTSPRDREDSGLQPERTLLSWQRTIILLVVVGLLFLRGPLAPGAVTVSQTSPAVRVVTMAVLLLMSAVLGVHLWLRWHRTGQGMYDPDTGGPPLSVSRPWAMLVLSATVLALSVVLLLTVVLS